MISFGDFAADFPDGQVLARPAVIAAAMAPIPTWAMTAATGAPSSSTATLDERLPGTERVVGVVRSMARSWPIRSRRWPTHGAINDEVAGTPIVVFHKPGTASALDSGAIAEGRDVGSAAVFERTLGDRLLTFAANGDGTFTDAETGSTWNILGEASAGPLPGRATAPGAGVRSLLVCVGSVSSGDRSL